MTFLGTIFSLLTTTAEGSRASTNIGRGHHDGVDDAHGNLDGLPFLHIRFRGDGLAVFTGRHAGTIGEHLSAAPRSGHA